MASFDIKSIFGREHLALLFTENTYNNSIIECDEDYKRSIGTWSQFKSKTMSSNL